MIFGALRHRVSAGAGETSVLAVLTMESERLAGFLVLAWGLVGIFAKGSGAEAKGDMLDFAMVKQGGLELSRNDWMTPPVRLHYARLQVKMCLSCPPPFPTDKYPRRCNWQNSQRAQAMSRSKASLRQRGIWTSSQLGIIVWPQLSPRNTVPRKPLRISVQPTLTDGWCSHHRPQVIHATVLACVRNCKSGTHTMTRQFKHHENHHQHRQLILLIQLWATSTTTANHDSDAAVDRHCYYTCTFITTLRTHAAAVAATDAILE